MSSARENLKGARFLLSSHTEETQPAIALTRASLKLSFADAAVASQLLQEGVYMFGEHRRVSVYKKRSQQS
jgi:hypothetical protein